MTNQSTTQAEKNKGYLPTNYDLSRWYYKKMLTDFVESEGLITSTLSVALIAISGFMEMTFAGIGDFFGSKPNPQNKLVRRYLEENPQASVKNKHGIWGTLFG